MCRRDANIFVSCKVCYQHNESVLSVSLIHREQNTAMQGNEIVGGGTGGRDFVTGY